MFRRNKINIFDDFKNITHTHFQKLSKKFQNRIPKELYQNFNIPRIGMNHWIISNFMNSKILEFNFIVLKGKLLIDIFLEFSPRDGNAQFAYQF